MNLGTDFTFGAWYKPYEFDSVFAVYTPDLNPIVELGGLYENDLPTFGWKVVLTKTGETYSTAPNPSNPDLSDSYPIIATWFLCSLRINANPLP